VVDDVRRIRNHPLVPSRIPIYGYIYNVKTGTLHEVTAATEGRSRELTPASRRSSRRSA
jgi:carbonic anhydrase